MPRFIAWGIAKVKGVFSAIAAGFARFFSLFKRAPSKYTYSVSNNDITITSLDEKNPKSYIADTMLALNQVDPDNRLFEADLRRFTSATFNSTDIYPAYDLTNLEGRNALVNDTLAKYGLTRDQMNPALAFLSQRLPQAVIMVLYGVFPERHFLSEDGKSTFKVDGSRLSLIYDLNIYVTKTDDITSTDMEKRTSGPYNLNLLTVATIDLAKLTVIDGKIQPGSDAITQTSTLTILKKLDLNLSAIDKKLHEEIQASPNETVAVTTTPPLAETLAKKNLLTPGFSSTDAPSETTQPPSSPPPPKLKAD